MTADSFVWGGHNLHDQAGVPTMFADAVIFTEAIPHTIQDDLGRPTTHQAAARTRLRLTGHTVAVCRQQPDLVFVCRRRLFKITGQSYKRYVIGRPKVTPNRGTWVLFTIHRPTGRQVAFVGEHRINAGFWPWIRGEARFRETSWETHTQGTLDTIERLHDSGWTVCAGGDLNTPHGVSGYHGTLHEVGTSLDRLGSTARIGGFESLSRKGSDHPRVRATVRL